MEDNYPNLDPWTFRPSITESCWFADAFAHETETLTRALQIALSTDADYTDVLAAVTAAGSPSHVVSPAGSPSDTETAPRRNRTPALSPPAGRVLKRKTRASKRSATTVVFTDPANFQHMVQQATGIPVGAARVTGEAELRPEPRPARRRVAMEESFLPTLDTSAFLLEKAAAAAAGSSAAPSPGSPAYFGSGPEGIGFDIDPPFPCFPTLESWGFM